jgi:hypothetical protein
MSAMAARATVGTALERRETRGCHNRSNLPQLDERLSVSLVWSGHRTYRTRTYSHCPTRYFGSYVRSIQPRQARRVRLARPRCGAQLPA